MKPKVSVIIPVYNVEKYLHQCLDSVVNQTLREIEIILVDNGSTDNSSRIVDEYASRDSRIIVIHQENSNAGHARNTGLDIASGDFLSFLDSDDWFELNMLEEMYLNAKTHNADIVTCNYQIFDEKQRSVKKNHFTYRECYFLQDGCCRTKDIGKFIFQFFGIVAWDKLFSANLIREKNIRFLEIATNNDIYFVLKSIVFSEKVSVLHTCFVTYRNNHGKSIQQSATVLMKSKNIVLTYKKFLHLLEEKHFICYKKSFMLRVYTTLIGDLMKAPTTMQYEFRNLVNEEKAFKNLDLSEYLICGVFNKIFYYGNSYKTFIFYKKIFLNFLVRKIVFAQIGIKFFGVKYLLKNIQNRFK